MKEFIQRIINKNNGLLSNWYDTIVKENKVDELLNIYNDKQYSNSKKDLKEICLRIINHIDNIPRCPICDKPVIDLQHDTCGSKECVKELRKRNIEQTNIEKYGVKNQFQRKEIIDYMSSEEMSKRRQEGFEKRYGDGITNCSQVKEFQKKRLKTFNERYGVDNAGQLDFVKEKTKASTFKRFGTYYYFQTDECRNKRKSKESLEREYATKKANGTMNSSEKEYEILYKLKKKFPNIINQYRSEKYPFNCDFYIPELDLYIEYQGFWTHGNHPFEPSNPEDIQLMNDWISKSSAKKLYANAVQTWTLRDPLKRKTAKENNLNWIEFFNEKEFNDWFDKI